MTADECEFEHEGCCIASNEYPDFRCSYAKNEGDGILLICTAENDMLMTEEEWELHQQGKDGEQRMSFTARLVIGGKDMPGTPIQEFLDLVKIVTKKYGKKVMIKECDKEGKMYLSLEGKHLGYIDINNGSLVWNKRQGKDGDQG